MGVFNIINNLLNGEQAPEPEGDPLQIADVEVELNEIRPMLESDGGGVHLIKIDDDGNVMLHLFGACSSCSAQASTVYELIQPRLMERLPWIVGVHSV